MSMPPWLIGIVICLTVVLLILGLTVGGFWPWVRKRMGSHIPSGGEMCGTLTVVSRDLESSPVAQGSCPAVPVQQNLSEDFSLPSPITSPLRRDFSVSHTEMYNMGENFNLGKIHVLLHYNFKAKILSVKVIQAVDLVGLDVGGKSDPYVMVWMIPKRNTGKMKTNVKNRTLNPTWNETFVFDSFPENLLDKHSIYFQVVDSDRFSSDDPLGELTLHLSILNTPNVAESQLDLWKYLMPCKDSIGPVGEIEVSLAFNRSMGSLTVIPMMARDLRHKNEGESDLNPYCKVKLFGPKDKLIEKKETAVVEKSANPVWNEGFCFFVPLSSLKLVSVDIRVVTKDFFRRQHVIGGVRFSGNANPEQQNHWYQMTVDDKIPIVRWHKLRP